MSDNRPKAKLQLRTKIAYAFGSFGFTIPISSLSVFLLAFYTDVALVSPAIASTALVVGKIWDTVNDPMVGWISDRTKSRWGRRRIFMFVAALPLAISMAALWLMPPGLSPWAAFAYIAVTYILFDTFFTLAQVPANALGAELTTDYDERTSLMSVAAVGAVLGYMVGSVATPALISGFASPQVGYLVAGSVFGAIVGICVVIVALKVKEPTRFASRVTKASPLTSIKRAFSNRPFVMLIMAFSFARVGFTVLLAVVPYYVKYQLQSPERLTLIMASFMIGAGLGIPLWKILSDRWSKSRAYALGLAIGLCAMLASFAVGSENAWAIWLIVPVAAFGFSAHWVLPWAMWPDVVEVDEQSSGERSEGTYSGLLGLGDKLARTLGIALVGLLLEHYGYVANTVQSTESLFGIRLLFGPLPALLLLCAVPLLFWFPITRQSHAALHASQNPQE